MNSKNTIVPPGVSGRAIQYDPSQVDVETVSNELLLLSLGDWEQLKFKIDPRKFKEEIKELEDQWVPYLPKTDRENNRQGLALTNLPGLTHQDNPSLGQASYAAGRRLNEADFCDHTLAYEKLPCTHKLLDHFSPLGRSFLVRMGLGGYFPPHRDHPTIPRDSFRIAVFLEDVGPMQFDWIHGNEKMLIEPGRAYYVNTRKVHRTVSWADRSTHLIINVPFNTESVKKLVANLYHAH